MQLITVSSLVGIRGVTATGHAGDASPAIFGQLGTEYLISPPKVCYGCCH